MDPIAAKYIGAGIACIGMGGAGVGVGTIFGNYLAAAIRNPSAAQSPFGNLIFGFAITEARANAQAIAAKTHHERAAQSETRRKELESGLAGKLAEAEKKIEATKSAARKNVHGIAVDAASAIVERLTGSVPEKPAVERAVSQAIN
jgi:F-type H+-transporting ATPase subunit c